MSQIAIFTTLEHRFNRTITVGQGFQVLVNSEGEAFVDERVVPYALNAGFELKDKNVQFQTLEQQELAKQIDGLLESARAQADEIISKAQKEAEKIINEARGKAGLILEENQVDEKEEARKNLREKTVEELKVILIESKAPESEWKKITKKDDLIEYIMKISFSE